MNVAIVFKTAVFFLQSFDSYRGQLHDPMKSHGALEWQIGASVHVSVYSKVYFVNYFQVSIL